ncbi:MAG: response regulator transcription factor [Sulfuricellaceae bacterium]
MSEQPTVFVVDDDDALRDSILWLLESIGLSAEMYPSASDFLKACNPERSGCLLLDVRMPGMSGMELLERLKANNVLLPVIIITGHGDVPMAVRAIKSGALDFIQKPFNGQDLLDRVQYALKLDQENRLKRSEISHLRAHFDTLTPREREIMEHVTAGKSSKIIARDLGISAKTVDIHRANIMKKLQVHSVADLIQTKLALSS